MLNTPLLRSVMVLHGDTQAVLANALGISPSRLNAKINETDGAMFVLREIKTIKDRYNLSADAICEIFFTAKLSQNEE